MVKKLYHTTSGEKFREVGNLLRKSLGKEGAYNIPQTPPRRQ